MSDPLVRAFFIGRAAAEAIGEQLEAAVTDALSELGRFDAQQRENLRQFTSQVLDRAAHEEELALQNRPPVSRPPGVASQPEDLQATIDEVRAEIAQLRAELQKYRNRTSP
ncbi:MAG: hypothetical protein VKK04_18360 [Synechococcales bacterium]|nr:hypothetical protein [Synechococcales bacterium]